MLALGNRNTASAHAKRRSEIGKQIGNWNLTRFQIQNHARISKK